MTRRPGPIIHINGYPGVGKYTIAKRLTELFPRLKLVHDKMFTDLCDSLLPHGTKDYWKAWGCFRETAFESILWSGDTYDYGYIFTDHIPFNEDSTAAMRNYTETATCSVDRQRELITITLFCTEKENVRRLVSVERQQNGKVTDPETLRDCRTTAYPHGYPEGCQHVIDVTNLDVEAAALTIAHRVGLRQ